MQLSDGYFSFRQMVYTADKYKEYKYNRKVYRIRCILLIIVEYRSNREELIMKKDIIECYENYEEEKRLTTNNARKLEFITTTRIFEDILNGKNKVLDCAAGTGAYSFWLASCGHDVTATDLTPGHIDIINEKLKGSTYNMSTAVLDAVDMSIFEDETFDAVLNMGPFYHLISEEERQKCLSESIRVLKKGGMLITAYIPRNYVFQYIAFSNQKYLDKDLADQILKTGVVRTEDKNCFWTDTYYSSKNEMEELYLANGITLTDHFAQDGIAPLLSGKVDSWDEEHFKIWSDFHYNICRDESILGTSNHVIIAGTKA